MRRETPADPLATAHAGPDRSAHTGAASAADPGPTHTHTRTTDPGTEFAQANPGYTFLIVLAICWTIGYVAERLTRRGDE